MAKKLLLLTAVLSLSLAVSGCFNKQVAEQPAANNPAPSQPAPSPEVTIGTELPIDLASSTLEWRSKKVAVKSEHYGLVSFSQGKLNFDGQTLIGGSFVLDMNSIIDQDLQGDMKGKLEQHLKSADFFDVAAYPQAELVIKSAALASTSSATGTASQTYNIVADLTIKGVSNTVEFPVSLERANGRLVVTAEFAIDRTLWGIQYGSGKFFAELGDKVIDDSIRFKARVEASDTLAAPQVELIPASASTTQQ